MNNQTLLAQVVKYMRAEPEIRRTATAAHISTIAQNLRSQGLNLQAFELAAMWANRADAQDRVALSDLAEWLCIDPTTQRKIQEQQTTVAA